MTTEAVISSEMLVDNQNITRSNTPEDYMAIAVKTSNHTVVMVHFFGNKMYLLNILG
jgi:hypothetical protein